jgi:ketosteroid isomerase-like protein
MPVLTPFARSFFATAILLAGCASSPARTTPIATGAVGALPSRIALLQADRALATAAIRDGLRAAFVPRFVDDATLLLPNVPTFASGEAARRLLADDLGARRAWWLPLHVEVSADSSLGISYGVMLAADSGVSATAPRHGKYVAAWRRAPDGWRVAAFAATGVIPPPQPQTIAAAGLVAPSLPASGPALAFAEADRAFAADAGRRGAAAAFGAFAAPDAVTFPATGDLAQGPREIEARLAEFSAATAWEWAPVIAGAAGSGDLGFTVGESIIRPRPGKGGETSYGKYLTVWRRLPDGRIAYVADAGSPRPATR